MNDTHDLEPPVPPGAPLKQLSLTQKITGFLFVGMAVLLVVSLFFHIDLAAPLEHAVTNAVPFFRHPQPQGTPSVNTIDTAATPNPNQGSSQLAQAVNAVGQEDGPRIAAGVMRLVAPGVKGAAAEAGLTSSAAVSHFRDAQRDYHDASAITPDDSQIPGMNNIMSAAGEAAPGLGAGVATAASAQTAAPAQAQPEVPIIVTPAPVEPHGPVVTGNNSPAMLGVTPGQQSGQTPETLSQMSVAQQAAFLNGNNDGSSSSEVDAYTDGVLQAARSNDEIWPGDPIDCILKNTVRSDVPGQAVCLVTSDVKSHLWPYRILIPATTQVWGAYNALVGQGQTRMQFRWDMMVFPNGATLPLSSVQAADTEGMAGIQADVDNHVGKVYTTTLVAALVGAFTGITQARAAIAAAPSYGQLLGTSGGNEAQQWANQAMQAAQSLPPTLTVHSGTSFHIGFAAIQPLPPYAVAAKRYASPEVRNNLQGANP